MIVEEVYLLLSLAGPNLGSKTGWMAVAVDVLSSGMTAAEVVGQNSSVTCGLALVHLYIQSLNNN